MITSAHIVAGEALGGAELFSVRLVNALHQQGHPVLAINSPGGGVSARLQADVTQLHVPMRAIWDLPSRWRISAILRQQQPDIVQTYMGRATRLTHVGRGRRPIHIARLGGYYNPHGYRHAHAWVAISPGIRDYLIRQDFPAQRVFHISKFVASRPPSPTALLSPLRCEFEIPDEALIVTGVGRLHPVKGFDDLLTAFAAVPAWIHQRPVYLILVVDGPMNAPLKGYARQLGIGQRVCWTGWRDDPGLFQELADLCVCSSRQEGLGSVILEAWARDRAVLSTCAQGPVDIITHGKNGWLTPLSDPAALASAMELLLRDASLRQQLAASGHCTFLARHSEDVIVSAYLALYQQLLAE